MMLRLIILGGGGGGGTITSHFHFDFTILTDAEVLDFWPGVRLFADGAFFLSLGVLRVLFFLM